MGDQQQPPALQSSDLLHSDESNIPMNEINISVNEVTRFRALNKSEEEDGERDMLQYCEGKDDEKEEKKYEEKEVMKGIRAWRHNLKAHRIQ